nr:GTP-sensing pleiotropic transcriptional regulator CodY [Eubacterium sp.]
MSVDLLDKTRKINRLLRDNRVSKVAFTDLCQVLGDLLESNVFVISSKGKVLGMSLRSDNELLKGLPVSKGKLLDGKFNKRFLEVLSTKENVNLETLGISESEKMNMQALIAPVYIAGKRLGTLFLYRRLQMYGIEDIILTEYSTTVVGLEMTRAVSEEKDYASRKQQRVDSAINILSPLERKAVECVIAEIHSEEDTIVTSRLAKEVGITRTVIINALKKMESAGLLETKSYGVKGTHIKILNDSVYTEFVK